MKILITGANGQLGQALQSILTAHTVYPYDHQALDIADEMAVGDEVRGRRPDVVINAAAYNNVDKAEAEPDAAQKVNGEAPGILARAAATVGATIIHVSTDYVFDGAQRRPYKESDATHPLSVYGRSKLAGEDAVAKGNPKHIVARTAWVYHTRGKNFLSTMLELGRRQPLRIVNDQFSSPTNALHLARGLMKIFEANRTGLFHVANAGAASRYEQFMYFLSGIGVRYEVTPIASSELRQAAARPAYSALATEHREFELPDWKTAIDEFAKAWEAVK